jgi:cell division protein FtsL
LQKKNKMAKESGENKARKITQLLDLDIKVTRENIPRILTFILFISAVIILYIANQYYSEKIVIKINKVNKEIKELRAESITSKAELMNCSKLSEILKKANELGLKEQTQPPKKVNPTK